jgi:ACS family glucarate transporter-like MFS transporter
MASESPSRVRWLLVAWISVVGAVSYLDRVNISIAGTSLAADFHLDHQQLGYIFSAFTLGYAMFQIAGGWLADRYGPRRILALGAVWWAVFTALTAAVPSRIAGAVLVFFAVRFLLGVGESVMYPCSNRWVSDWIPRGERGFANGILFTGVGAGAAITPPIITAVMTRYGWRSSFWICAIIGLLAGAVWFWLARDHPDQHPWVNDGERARILEGVPEGEGKETHRLPWSVILSSGTVWLITFSYFCYSYAAYIFFSWFFIYLTAVRGMNLKSGSYYAALPFIAMSAGSALGGLVSDRVSRLFGRRWGRCGTAILGLSGAALFILIGSRAASPATASVILAGGAGALYFSLSSFWAMTADLGRQSSGSLSGFMNMGGQIGSAITASLTPFIASHFGWTSSFLVASVFCFLGALIWLFVDPNQTLAAS